MSRRTNGIARFPIKFALLLVSILATSAFADSDLLGKVNFPNSGAAEAQPDFIEGVLYLHNFEYDEARSAFQRSRDIDPSFALAYWGEAMTHHQSLWRSQSLSMAQDVLQKLGRTAAQRSAKAPSQREKDYLRAVETLFGMTDASAGLSKYERDVLYRDVMRDLHEAYPDDHEATVFYGLSILGVGSANREYGTYMRAAAVLTKVWDANRMHPGAAHYLIHSYDDPVHAVLGVPMARAYSVIAPAAAHAQHMTSHIFVALGFWDETVTANLKATKVEINEITVEGEWNREALHYIYWLHYGYLQQGRYGKARELMNIARERLHENANLRERANYGVLYARYLFDTEDWKSATAWLAPGAVKIPSVHYDFARAFAAIKLGNLDAARKITGELQPGGDGNPEVILGEDVVSILRKELEAMFALADGDGDKTATLLRQAIAEEVSMPFRYGPPRVVKPAAELLGDVLLELGRTKEAADAYREQLTRAPRRTNALLGLARAASVHDDSQTADYAYRLLSEIWHNADPDVPGLTDVRRTARLVPGTGDY